MIVKKAGPQGLGVIIMVFNHQEAYNYFSYLNR